MPFTNPVTTLPASQITGKLPADQVGSGTLENTYFLNGVLIVDAQTTDGYALAYDGGLQFYTGTYDGTNSIDGSNVFNPASGVQRGRIENLGWPWPRPGIKIKATGDTDATELLFDSDNTNGVGYARMRATHMDLQAGQDYPNGQGRIGLHAGDLITFKIGNTINGVNAQISINGTTVTIPQAVTISGLTSLINTAISGTLDATGQTNLAATSVGGSLTVTGTSTLTDTTVSSLTVTTERLLIQNPNSVTLTSTNHPFQIGLDNSTNLRIDRNSIDALANGAVSSLALQSYGGAATFGGTLSAPKKMQAGTTPAITIPTANTMVTYAVTFPTAFNTVPAVVISPNTGTSAVTNCTPSGMTTTGFTINIMRTTTTATAVMWIAMVP